jgi:hypothetical protein
MECTLRAIFQQHFEAYAARHRLPAYVHRAAYWIARCRTAQLGGHLRRCPEGHTERAFYNSCHQRICPQCQGLATERWLERQRARLLECVHHHLIFTIPHELNALWCWNRSLMAKLLFGAVRDTLMELLGDPRYLGARAAFGQPPALEPAPLAVEDFLARFDRTPAAATCALCGARLRFVPLIAHGSAPPPPLP